MIITILREEYLGLVQAYLKGTKGEREKQPSIVCGQFDQLVLVPMTLYWTAGLCKGCYELQSFTRKNKPGIGLFISAVKSGQRPYLTKPGSGWKEWVVGGTAPSVIFLLAVLEQRHYGAFRSLEWQRLWSEVRALSWSEIETLAQGAQLEQYAA